MAQAKKLPASIVQQLEEKRIPRNSMIYYSNGMGWISCERDTTGVGATLPSTHDDSESVNRTVRDTPPEETECPLKRLGPFGIQTTTTSLSIIPETSMYQIEFDRQLSSFSTCDNLETVGQHAPMAAVTLSGVARDVANIPHEATHFCWIYPPAGFTQLSVRQKAKIDRKLANGDPEYTFLALGGFAYFRFEHCAFKTLRINCLIKADNGLIFNGPLPWRADYTADLLRNGRFQDATISELLELGIKVYCFVNPNERLNSSRKNAEDWIPAPNGGFVYLYDSKQRPHKYDCYFTIADAPLSGQISSHVMPFSLIRNRQIPPPSSARQRLSSTESMQTGLSPVSNEVPDRFTCSICLTRTVRCLFIPCKHMCTCVECAQQVRQALQSVCPICRQVFTEVWDVFL